MAESSKAVIALTPGEPAGIGPDITLQLAASDFNAGVPLVAVASPALMRERAQQLGLSVTITEIGSESLSNNTLSSELNSANAELLVLPVEGYHTVETGQPDAANAAYVLRSLDTAIQICQQNKCAAMVTGPVNKHIINQGLQQLNSDLFFSGHTEYLAQQTNTSKVVMMLAGFANIARNQQLRVALATTHLPLSQVAQSINSDELEQVIHILHRDLQQKFGLTKPLILVCGLNPHAGEQGDLGREELDIINPLLERLRSQGFNLSDTLPADTLFTPHHLQEADAVLAMYHDQGLPVLKSHCFGKAANITLGLPIVRTSVDHGTAFDLAGSGKASTGSLETAIQYARAMVQQ